MTKRPTIVDVARHAGVSKSTVSLVLQQSPLVRDSTRDQVLRSIDALNYFRNRSAANLRGEQVGLIGLIINDLRNPFFTEFAISVQMSLAARGFTTVVANTGESDEVQEQVLSSMMEHGVSGLVICPAYGERQGIFDRVRRARIPTLEVLRRVSQDGAGFPFFSLDFRSGGRDATRHLLDAGARRVAFIGGFENRLITRERMSGSLDVMAERGLEPFALHGRPSRAIGREMAFRLARDHPDFDGVLCFNDLIALGMLAGFQELGLEVGSRFRVVGFDGTEDCSLVYPQLSSVDCDIARFGRATAETMLRWLQTDAPPPAETRLPVALVARQSTLGPGGGTDT